MAEIINFDEAKKRHSSKQSRPKRKTDDEIKKEMISVTLEIGEKVMRLMELIHEK